jgi:hypothetical protein
LPLKEGQVVTATTALIGDEGRESKSRTDYLIPAPWDDSHVILAVAARRNHERITEPERSSYDW